MDGYSRLSYVGRRSIRQRPQGHSRFAAAPGDAKIQPFKPSFSHPHPIHRHIQPLRHPAPAARFPGSGLPLLYRSAPAERSVSDHLLPAPAPGPCPRLPSAQAPAPPFSPPLPHQHLARRQYAIHRPCHPKLIPGSPPAIPLRPIPPSLPRLHIRRSRLVYPPPQRRPRHHPKDRRYPPHPKLPPASGPCRLWPYSPAAPPCSRHSIQQCVVAFLPAAQPPRPAQLQLHRLAAAAPLPCPPHQHL